ncbi:MULTISPECIES: cytochrome c biogenesis protein [Archaeoglobus]|jgi:heme exporter protein C|uniref:Heme exporter protein C (HelC) n=2 Tax=Archaeoglobus fulgidus TaxID=2234 RepID=O28299_ARCFU|nr:MULTISPECIES: cytochrome c biogenesis protein [Archaeoglobus]AAB89274.1 heme exporter protein C (helC) [Archaeoglobus fulgidus DSM 4304]AIG98972.1 ABC-type transport system involved in cytochrome c biogenesis, permease component [Archaeoglobus fulgidus DSM 8774]MDI3497801.1 heme exporter protein [Archaeoglobus sp.]
MWSKASALCFFSGFAMLVYGVYKVLSLAPVSSPTIAENYRIIFFHVPAAVTSFVAFAVTLAFSVVFLKTENYRRDVQAVSSAKFGFAMITAALISGSIWAKVAWGSYWNWDPRETFVLVLWFAYAAYFGLRASIEDYAVKARYSAIYSIFAFVTVPMSYFSSLLSPLHPKPFEVSFDTERGMLLGVMIIAFILLYIAFFLLDSKISEIREKLEVMENE